MGGGGNDITIWWPHIGLNKIMQKWNGDKNEGMENDGYEVESVPKNPDPESVQRQVAASTSVSAYCQLVDSGSDDVERVMGSSR